MKTKILFVCMGNICRSPAAEGIMKKIVKESAMEDSFHIDSAGTHGYHQGELPDRRMREHAFLRGYKLDSFSRPVKVNDFYDFDIIIAMDDNNIDHLRSIAPDSESYQKVVRMTDYCRKLEADHVPDPYYGGKQGFENVLDILEDACKGLMEKLKS